MNKGKSNKAIEKEYRVVRDELKAILLELHDCLTKAQSSVPVKSIDKPV